MRDEGVHEIATSSRLRGTPRNDNFIMTLNKVKIGGGDVEKLMVEGVT